ncbi:hypothetical protein [Cryobacterium sp. Y11]|uniref:hypothetical protein n=1 Tax=Cryobacterium sp. Y11 TaxID=2045016 RepID=UPI000CE51AF1|nr:hypothetical protein [Cryobacterium sp. Y11]
MAINWQVQVVPDADAAAVRNQVRTAAGVTTALPVTFAHTTGLTATTQGATQATDPGAVLGLPDGYLKAIPGEIRQLTGTRTGVLIAQQTAANPHVAPGDTIMIGLAGTQPVEMTISGVVDLPQANSLFQTVGAPAQS